MLLASFIAPFFNPTPVPTQQNDGNLGYVQKQRLSQRERKALRSKLARSQKGNDKFLVEVQGRAKHFSHSEWTVEPQRNIGEVTSWNQRSAFGFIKSNDFDSEIVLYARDIDHVPEEYDGQKKVNWCGFHVEFEMKYENQARAVNVKILNGREAVRFLEEKSSLSTSSEDGYSSDGWSEDTSSTTSMPQQGGANSPKQKSVGAKFKSVRSRRNLARDAEMDLKEWQEESETRSKYFYTTEFRRQFGRDPDYDDIVTVQKRHTGHKLKLEREREHWKKTRKVKYLNESALRKRTETTSSRSSIRAVPMAAAPKTKWIAPKKDTHFALFYKMFERIATATPALQNRDVVRLIVQKLYDKIIVSEGLKKHIVTSRTSAEEKQHQSECPVCFTEFLSNDVCEEQFDEKSDGVEPPRMSNCGHASLCFDCLQRYVSLKIGDGDDILPWISCPAEKCRAPIHFSDLLDESMCGISTAELYTFCRIILQKQLSRSPQFVECSGKIGDTPCDFGFFCDKGASVRRTCKCCGLVQEVTPKAPEEFLDDGFKSMLRAGVLRLCPSCSHPAMKDYGMCNVMECGKCGIFWNWNSKQTGSTYNQVKENGRRFGTLWEPGELGYQLNLQQTNPMAFKELLERNGIKYDPNFVRGRS